MFQSYESHCIQEWTRYTYTIIDDDFQEHFVCATGWNDFIPMFVAVYERRNLPVSPNLMLMIRWRVSRAGGTMVGTIRTVCGALINSNFAHYKEELDKYLILT